VRVLFLDIDGVLNRADFQPGDGPDLELRHWIEPELARRLSEIIQVTGTHLVLSSDWRLENDLPYLQQELLAAGVTGQLVGTTPVLEDLRWREIHAWMTEHGIASEDAVIVDDTHDMGPLRRRFVRTSSQDGLDAHAADAILRLFGAT